MSYNKLTQKEWETTAKSAKKRFVADIMGTRPTRREISSGMYNDEAISLLEWLGLVLLIAIAVVTGFKMTALAIPFAASFYPAETPAIVVTVFAVSMATVFVLISTSGLIYYQIMNEYDAEVQRLKAKHPRLSFTGGWRGAVLASTMFTGIMFFALGMSPEASGILALVAFGLAWYLGGLPTNLLEYVSPRLYLILTYLTSLWLLFVSSAGDGSFFERYLIVIAEVALAYLVAGLIQKRTNWRATVNAVYTDKTNAYDNRLTAYAHDSDYLQILYIQIRETLVNVQRRIRSEEGGKYMTGKPNAYLSTADANVVETAVLSEYKRMVRGGERFAAIISGAKNIVPQPQAEPKDNEKRIPPLGDKYWTDENLHQSLLVRGITPADNYTEQDLARDYKDGFRARTVWRNGVKTRFA